jgi:hypothetical protein
LRIKQLESRIEHTAKREERRERKGERGKERERGKEERKGDVHMPASILPKLV